MEDRNYGTIRIKLDEMIEQIGSPRRNAKDPTQPVL